MGNSLAGKTIIVTGDNSGIGYKTARQYLTLGASRVIITVRSETKCQEAISALRADSAVMAANPSAEIEAFQLDLSDYRSALGFCQKAKEEVPELDILLCNAGLNIVKYEESKSGHEMVMQVNCYTNFFIACELPLLRATAFKRETPSRLTFVGSGMHTMSKPSISSTETFLEHFDNHERYNGLTRYSDPKLAVNVLARQLAMTVSSNEVIINNVCPGMVATGFDKTMPAWIRLPFKFIRVVVARSVEVGGWTLFYATAVIGSESHGRFIQSNKIESGAPFLDESKGKEFIEKLWTGIVEEVKSVDPDLKITL